MKEETSKFWLLFYVFLVFITGIVLLVFVLLKYRNISLLGVILFGILIFASDNLSAPLPKTGSVSVNFGISLASLIIFGPATGILVTFISIFNIREIIKRVPYYKHLFNAGQYLISFAAASIFFELFYDRTQQNFFYPRNIWVIFLVTYIFFILNTTMGRLLSMQRVIAVESITVRLNFKTPIYDISSNFFAVGSFTGSAV